jgi:hypothetical protein
MAGIFYAIHRIKKRYTEFNYIGSAAPKKTIIIAFAIPDPVPLQVEGE